MKWEENENKFGHAKRQMHALSRIQEKRVTDGPTDRPTDGRTDPVIEMRGRI